MGVVACGARTGLDFDTESDAGLAVKDGSIAPLRSLDAGEVHAMDAAADASDARAVDAAADASDARATDAGADTDASSLQPPMARCDDGVVAGNVFGEVLYFAGGALLPAGRYRMTYVGGCMLYSGDEAWTVNATTPSTPGGIYSWWIVGATSSEPVIIPPGTLGYEVGSGGYATYESCVAANASDPFIDFDFTGGRIGVWLDDAPYSDNVAGPSGGTPTWKLDCAH
jgi:hypothetical protein